MPAKHTVMNGLAAQGPTKARYAALPWVDELTLERNYLAGRPWHHFGKHSGMCLECLQHMDSPALSEVCTGKDGRA